MRSIAIFVLILLSGIPRTAGAQAATIAVTATLVSPVTTSFSSEPVLQYQNGNFVDVVLPFENSPRMAVTMSRQSSEERPAAVAATPSPLSRCKEDRRATAHFDKTTTATYRCRVELTKKHNRQTYTIQLHSLAT